MANNTVCAIGIMSGTSLDAVDAVALSLTDKKPEEPPQIIRTYSEPVSNVLRQQLIDLCQPGDNEIERAGRCHTILGRVYANVARKLIEHLPETLISVIGCHGQTVRHQPSGEAPYTLQLGNGAVIAALTGIPVVTDFRSADMVRGGQGAPFAPFFHKLVFGHPTRCRAVLNLGGIANVTLLPCGEGTVTGFDTGPANGLLDAWIDRHHGLPFDKDGLWASSGQLHPELLEHLLQESYLLQPPPKSTGRELFNIDWLEQMLSTLPYDISSEDVQLTLAHFTAASIAGQIPHDVEEIYCCGGGSKNPLLMNLLSSYCHTEVAQTDAIGFSPEWIEASAFAWMALATLHHRHCTLPSVTGASGSSVAGAIYYP